MKTYKNGSKVEYGVYVSLKALDVRFVGSAGETLEGKRGAEYFHVPALLMVALAPVLGGLFALCFPLMVIAMAAAAFVKLVYNGITNAIDSRAHIVTMNWEPSAAHLNKSKRDGDKAADGKSELKDLEKEVKDRRQNENGEK